MDHSSSRDSLFSQTLNTSSHEIATLCTRLALPNTRFETLKQLRQILRRNGHHVPHINQSQLFDTLHEILVDDKRPQVVNECLWLIIDVIPQLHDTLDDNLSNILPIVVTMLGSDQLIRSSLRLIHVLMRNTLNLQKVLKVLIEFGIESNDVTIQKGVVMSVPLIFSDEFQNENLYILVKSLSRLLVRADNHLFYPVFVSLQRINSILGNQVFNSYLDDEEARELYTSVLSRNPSADSQTDTYMEQETLRFGVFPFGLISSALSSKSEERISAIETVLMIVKESPMKKLVPILDHWNDFLVDFLSNSLLEQNSFKVTLLALDILEVLIERLKTSLTPSLDTIVAILAKRLGDGRTVVRDSVIKVMHALMYTFPPQQVLDILLTEKPSKNPKIREEVVNRVTAAVLTFPRTEFNLMKLCLEISPLLTDGRRCVRLASLECLAVLAQALTPNRIQPLIACVETIESTCQMDGLLAAVKARLARRQLPRCGSDGTIRYVLNPHNFSGWFQNANDADLEWIMMATPSSNGGTPPKTKTSIPLANIPFDPRRSQRKSLAENNIQAILQSGQVDTFDQFRGQSFNSEDERRDSEETEVWKQYFSRFRKQLAEEMVFEKEFKSLEQFQPISAQDMELDVMADEGNSPTSSDGLQVTFDPHLERSMSMPSLPLEQQEEEEQQQHELVPIETTDDKPSPMLGTPLPPPEASQNEPQTIAEEEEEEVNEPTNAPILSVQEATPLHRRSSTVAEPIEEEKPENTLKSDVWTQKDENSSENSPEDNKKSKTPQMRRKRAQPIGRQSRSQSPRRRPSRPAQQIYIKTTPAIPANANIRHILVNVAKTEGPFDNPQEAVKAAIMALHDDAWTTKIEGMLAITRLATFHSHYLLRDQHQIVTQLIQEVKNLRSTVSRSAIFTLGELFYKLKTQIEPEMDPIVSCLLWKSGENIVFMREDIEKALFNCLDEMPQTRTALALIHSGSNHRNSFVRKTCSHFLSILVDRMGPIKCLLGPRDIGEHLLPAASRFVQDQNPQTRFFGRKIFSVLMSHVSFEKLLRKHVTPGTYRNICGILESIKRRGIGEPPQDLISPAKATPPVID